MNYIYKKIKEFKFLGFIFSYSKPMPSENIILEMPKSLIEDLRREFKLAEEMSNEDVMKTAISVSLHAARNGFFVFDKNYNIPGLIYGGRN